MKSLFLEKELFYDGSQLKSLFGYFQCGVAGDSIVSFVGGCDISAANMADGEDILAKAEIRGGKMLHFIVEKFNIALISGVLLQRLLTSLTLDAIRALALDKEKADRLVRDGDDIFLDNKKLSISIAAPSHTSVLIHFAMNITNENTPVPTLSLEDLKVDPVKLSRYLMEKFCDEEASIIFATQKVRGVRSY
jgi:uncharacterized protein